MQKEAATISSMPRLNPYLNDSLRNVFYFAYEWERLPEWNFDNYQIPALTVWYILDGNRYLSYEEREYKLQPGDLLVLPNQAVITTRHEHANQPSQALYYLSLGMQFTIGAWEWPELYGIPVHMRPSRDDDVRLWLADWRELARRYTAKRNASAEESALIAAPSVTEYLAWEACFKQWLARLIPIVQPHMADPEPRTDQRLFHVCNFIHTHYAAPLSLKEIAQYACLSEGHLRAIFRQSLNMSPYQYVIQTRLSRAKQLLLTTNLTLAEIAATVGFDDLSHFISLFRKKTGSTPAQYRKKSDWNV
ncbi:helix-turn-helix transcriptional regulator [Paenibacillus sp. IB182496]|uniref:Helix-turn-helix transcriptional regulator n=1 Tax=Paenibacillus sabuli TaxID=2772509 RepID=A0A927BTF5_9BACL|nr:AraC family transcriptional regulator [Paenibacillus sabuli]MBD2845450.1 helix-turn-helix transcriptional regulator [Paenibacillus sabuli]